MSREAWSACSLATPESLWSTRLSLGIGDASVSEDLRHWVNEGLMALFFLVVGLEIKRELAVGELRAAGAPQRCRPSPPSAGWWCRQCSTPPPIWGQEGAGGWGIPMATNIAFALGVLALLGSRIKPSLRLFLLTLAIVDDIGAIVVIAAFYSDGIRWLPLGAAAVLLLAVGLLPRAWIYWLPAYAALALGVWALVFASGVHATIPAPCSGSWLRPGPRPRPRWCAAGPRR